MNWIMYVDVIMYVDGASGEGIHAKRMLFAALITRPHVRGRRGVFEEKRDRLCSRGKSTNIVEIPSRTVL